MLYLLIWKVSIGNSFRILGLDFFGSSSNQKMNYGSCPHDDSNCGTKWHESKDVTEDICHSQSIRAVDLVRVQKDCVVRRVVVVMRDKKICLARSHVKFIHGGQIYCSITVPLEFDTPFLRTISCLWWKDANRAKCDAKRSISMVLVIDIMLPHFHFRLKKKLQKMPMRRQ